MAREQELKENNPLHKEFQNLLDQDFKDRKLKENEIIKLNFFQRFEDLYWKSINYLSRIEEKL